LKPAGQLTLFAAASLDSASLLVLPGSEEAKKMTATSGRKCSVLLRNCGPAGFLVKMLLESSVWHSTICYLTWKVSATKRGRLLFRLVPSAPHTGGTGCGLWPTPRGGEKGVGLCGGTGHWQMLLKALPPEEVKAVAAGNGGRLNPDWVECLMGFPIGYTDVE